MTEIVLASNNRKKIAELETLLEKCASKAISVKTLRDIGYTDEIVEDGTSFEENSLIKASTPAKLGYIGIADDSGLCVDFLGGKPGIYSARYSGEGANDERNREKLLRELDGVAEELAKEGYTKESIDRYLALFEGVSKAQNGIKYLADTLQGFLEPEVEQNLQEIIDSVEAAKTADFKMVFDPTLVRGMSYYTGTIFEIAMPELGAACGGGGRYDKMVGKFTGNDVPACGFSIGFERIILLLMESGFTVPMQRPKVAYLIEKGCTSEQVSKVIARAQEERVAGKQVLVVRMNKNKKFQKEKLTAEGYKDIVEFYKD